MRIRTIKPEFFRHEELYDAEIETGLPLRVAFAGLWCASDREGRFQWRPRTLKSEILPFDEVDFSRVLHALATRGFIVNYASPTGQFGYIPTFLKHQVVNNRERASEFPNPLDCNDSDACPTRAPRVPHAGKAEGNKEGNKEQGDSTLNACASEGGIDRPKRDAIPSLDDVKRYARSAPVPISEECAVGFHDASEARGWVDRQGLPIANWQAALRRWATQWNANDARQPAARGSTRNPSAADHAGYDEKITLD